MPAQAFFRRAAHPSEAALAGWGERELRDHDEFRNAFLVRVRVRVRVRFGVRVR